MDIIHKEKKGCPIDCPYRANREIQLWDAILESTTYIPGHIFPRKNTCFQGSSMNDEICKQSSSDKVFCNYSILAFEKNIKEKGISPERYIKIKDVADRNILRDYVLHTIDILNKEVNPKEFLDKLFRKYREKGLTYDVEPYFPPISGALPYLEDGVLMNFNLIKEDKKLWLFMKNKDVIIPEEAWLEKRGFMAWISNGATEYLFPKKEEITERHDLFGFIPRPVELLPGVAAALPELETMNRGLIGRIA